MLSAALWYKSEPSILFWKITGAKRMYSNIVTEHILWRSFQRKGLQPQRDPLCHQAEIICYSLCIKEALQQPADGRGAHSGSARVSSAIMQAAVVQVKCSVERRKPAIMLIIRAWLN